MRVGLIQSSFVPWRGYFDFIRSVDLFVFHEDVQYTKGDWRNRNRIKTARGLEWITVPVRYERTAQLICDTGIDRSQPWWKKLAARFELAYRDAPYLEDARALLGGAASAGHDTISELNIALVAAICRYLGIATPLMRSTEIGAEGRRTDKILDILARLDADVYLSGPSADDYLDKEAFRRAGVRLEYKSYDYLPYPQRWGAFEGAVSILDLIANCGPAAGRWLDSATPDRVVVDPRSGGGA